MPNATLKFLLSVIRVMLNKEMVINIESLNKVPQATDNPAKKPFSILVWMRKKKIGPSEITNINPNIIPLKYASIPIMLPF